MDWILQTLTESQLYQWETVIGDWFFAASIGFLLIELLLYGVKKQFTRNLLGDTLANFVTLVLFLAVTFSIAVIYLNIFYYVHEWRFFTVEITPLSIIAAVVLADLTYYWEHRFTHRVGFGWATHTVHHSSPHFNISVAYRFGPLDGVIPLVFHLPMILLGFNPILVLFAEALVQLYQTALHTEVVKKLPRWFEAVMNTPSHHRVHHGSNREYIDKNYGGIFIVWDKLFGTFAEERATVKYGVVPPVNSVNPLKIFFSGLVYLGAKMRSASSVGVALAYLIKPPGWRHKR
ncbi:sterol desaturase family protein [bacterium SCSIO 12696]|nr:sterol desaturase family protein [bacterium SCSIO 12696]